MVRRHRELLMRQFVHVYDPDVTKFGSGLCSRVVPFQKSLFHYFVNSKYFQVFESSLTSSLYIRVTKSYAARSGCEIKAHVTRPWLLQIKLWQKIEKSTSWQIYTVDLTLLSSGFRFRSLLLKSAYLHLRLNDSRWLNFDPNLEPKMTSYFEISSENWDSNIFLGKILK